MECTDNELINIERTNNGLVHIERPSAKHIIKRTVHLANPNKTNIGLRAHLCATLPSMPPFIFMGDASASLRGETREIPTAARFALFALLGKPESEFPHKAASLKADILAIPSLTRADILAAGDEANERLNHARVALEEHFIADLEAELENIYATGVEREARAVLLKKWISAIKKANRKAAVHTSVFDDGDGFREREDGYVLETLCQRVQLMWAYKVRKTQPRPTDGSEFA